MQEASHVYGSESTLGPETRGEMQELLVRILLSSVVWSFVVYKFSLSAMRAMIIMIITIIK